MTVFKRSFPMSHLIILNDVLFDKKAYWFTDLDCTRKISERKGDQLRSSKEKRQD